MKKINLYGEIHPENVDLLRNTQETIQLLERLSDKINLLSEVKQDLFYSILDNIKSDYYFNDLRLYDSRLNFLYNNLRNELSSNDILLMEGVLYSINELRNKLVVRGLNDSFFRSIVLIDKEDYRFKSLHERENNWLMPINKFVSEGFDLHVIAGRDHFRPDSLTSINNLKKLYPNKRINCFLMEKNYETRFIKDCDSLNEIVNKFIKTY